MDDDIAGMQREIEEIKLDYLRKMGSNLEESIINESTYNRWQKLIKN